LCREDTEDEIAIEDGFGAGVEGGRREVGNKICGGEDERRRRED
jgi:hypothetical protein